MAIRYVYKIYGLERKLSFYIDNMRNYDKSRNNGSR